MKVRSLICKLFTAPLPTPYSPTPHLIERARISRLFAGAAVMTLLAATAWGQQKAPTDKPVAIVNGVPISNAEVEAILRQDGPTLIELPAERRRQLREETLEQLIDNVLMRQFLQQQALPIDPAEVDKQLAQLQDEQKQKGKTLDDFYRATNQNEAQVRANIGYALQWHAYVNKHLTAEDIKRYYEDNRDFFDKVLVRVSHIELRIPARASEAERVAAQNKLLAPASGHRCRQDRLCRGCPQVFPIRQRCPER